MRRFRLCQPRFPRGGEVQATDRDRGKRQQTSIGEQTSPGSSAGREVRGRTAAFYALRVTQFPSGMLIRIAGSP